MNPFSLAARAPPLARRHRLEGCPYDVVLRLRGGQRRAGGLGVEAKAPRLGVAGIEALAHEARPQSACGAELGHFLEKVVVGVEEKRDLRGKLIDREDCLAGAR